MKEKSLADREKLPCKRAPRALLTRSCCREILAEEMRREQAEALRVEAVRRRREAELAEAAQRRAATMMRDQEEAAVCGLEFGVEWLGFGV